jgi:cysteinyl-tRNA synthetase
MLKFYNTMTRSVDEFVPINDKNVGIYTCGPTVYNFAHIGNLRTYVFEDILKRTLNMLDYKVKHVMNVTDVGHLVSDEDTGEDKMELGAAREGKSVWDIADFYWQAFREDMKRLNLLEPNVWSKATDHITEQINMIKSLEEKGYTYSIEDGVYFDTSKLDDYGKLARLDIEGLQAGLRVEMAVGKKNLTDFALWKLSPKDKQRLMEWESPWGTGFPGWHLECSAMALKYLGKQLDIHCGGIDHVNVHHTNEIAQTESVTGDKWVNWWMHGEFLTMSRGGEDEKMSKSSGEFLTLDVLAQKGYDPLAYRYFCMSAHYRMPLAFSFEGLDAATNALERLRTRVIEIKAAVKGEGTAIEKHMDDFRAAICDDLNMPRALAALWGLLKDTDATREDVYSTLLEMDKIFGFDIAEMKAKEVEVPQEILALLDERQAARKSKDFARADAIRDELTAKGYAIEDSATGPRVKKI